MYSPRISTPENRDTFWRTLQTFCITRILITVVLLAYFSINAARDERIPDRFADWQTCLVYLLVAIGFGLLSAYARRRFMLQLVSQLVIDISAISLLYVLAGGARSGLAILYLFPLSGVAILAPMMMALFFVSIVTLILLAESLYQVLNSVADVSPSQAGLYGAAFFAAIFLINRLAARLIKQEALAAQRGRDLQLQEAINRLVIADMGDGIVVVGDDTEVFAGNPAAERMLGMSVAYGQPRYKLADLPALGPIADAFTAWRKGDSQRMAPDGSSSVYVKVKPVGGNTRDLRRELAAHLKLRFATVEGAGLTNDRTVIFLQDVSEIENQAQQLKLASMGRLTASIAHEVRNPLSAISHAASLLDEDVVDPTQKRLLNIVSDNVVRLNRMIEDILKLSRKAHAQADPVRLAPFLSELVSELRSTHKTTQDLIRVEDMAQLKVHFDALHLREVVVNLLSNALRYASGGPGSICVHAVLPAANRLELHIQDDGPAITPEVRAHLFEPFYTTSSKGTGLGLYVARELCLNNGAMLDYEYRTDSPGGVLNEPSGRFVITFAV